MRVTHRESDNHHSIHGEYDVEFDNALSLDRDVGWGDRRVDRRRTLRLVAPLTGGI
jgi:hypothetical protein